MARQATKPAPPHVDAGGPRDRSVRAAIFRDDAQTRVQTRTCLDCPTTIQAPRLRCCVCQMRFSQTHTNANPYPYGESRR